MKLVGFIIKKVMRWEPSDGYGPVLVLQSMITHRLYYAGDKIGNIPVAVAVKEKAN